MVVDAHCLHSMSNDYGYVCHAFEGVVPGGIPGGIRYVRISGHHVNRDCFEIVRAPGPPDVLISALEVQGPQRGELRAYGGHRTADAPFGVGDVRKRDLPGVRHHRARAPRNFSTDGSASSASNRERLPARKSSRHSAMRRCALPRRADVEQPLPPGGERRRGRSGGWDQPCWRGERFLTPVDDIDGDGLGDTAHPHRHRRCGSCDRRIEVGTRRESRCSPGLNQVGPRSA